MVRLKRKRLPDFNIHTDAPEPFPGNHPPDTQSREHQLQGILAESTTNPRHYDTRDVEKLRAASDLARFFSDQVTVPQRDIDRWAGFSEIASRCARNGESIADKIASGKLIANLCSTLRHLIKEEINWIDEGLENGGY